MKTTVLQKNCFKSILLCIVCLFSFISCEREEEPSDLFVGNYIAVLKVHFVSQFGGSRDSSGEGGIKITKIDSDMVRMSGEFNTSGVVEGNTVQFNDYVEKYEFDNGGYAYYNYSFSKAVLNGNTITFKVNFTGTDYFNTGGSATFSGYENVELRKIKK